MPKLVKLIRPLSLMLLIASVSACSVGVDRDYYDDDYPWYYTRYGTYTVVRRPVVVVDGWTNRAFRYRPYRGYRVRRHNSPVIKYNASRGPSVLEVDLTPMGDSTKVEIRARNGDDKWEPEQAKVLMTRILQKP